MMSAGEATEFPHFSVHNAVQAEAVCPDLECRAYEDIFTFRRWRAQGYAVRAGEDGARITTWLPVTKTDENGNRVVGKRPKAAVVFCRHQVEEIEQME